MLIVRRVRRSPRRSTTASSPAWSRRTSRVTISYTLWLKHEPVIDLAAVAAGFVFRAIAGGVATGVTLSDWFLIVAGAGSLFMVTGKRHAEQVELGSDFARAPQHARRVLHRVPRATCARSSSGVMITAYCLWAFENAAHTGDTTWFRLSIVPFVLAVLRYALVIEQGGGGAPEEVVLADRVLQIVGVIWMVTFALGVRGWMSVAEPSERTELLTGWGRTAPTAAIVVAPDDADDVDALLARAGGAG